MQTQRIIPKKTIPDQNLALIVARAVFDLRTIQEGLIRDGKTALARRGIERTARTLLKAAAKTPSTKR